MINIDIQKAREWAKKYQRHHVIGAEGELAAVRVIQSLPDHIIDLEKASELADDMANWSLPDGLNNAADDFRHLIGIMGGFADRINDILTPPLPTLADMTPEEREACQWMQADVKLTNGGSATCVIANPRIPGAKVRVWAPHGGSDDVEEGRVTPLPDLPKLEWPGSHADTITAESVEDVQAGHITDFEPALHCPEDVPAGESWSVRYWGKEWVGVRSDHLMEPWSIISMDGLDYRDVDDSEITLMFRLVPETL